jgi:short-subunit dehydrogenase
MRARHVARFLLVQLHLKLQMGLHMNANPRPLAVITGASSGIGLELARECAKNGFDLIIAADRSLAAATTELRAVGANVEAIEADLATSQGVEELWEVVQDRPIAALLANAGHGLGKGFLDQSFADITHVIDTNITGTLSLIHRVGKDMRARDAGRILITGSIAGFMPGSFQAVYNGTKAFIDSFSWALRNELKGTGVTVTCLMPGATETEFFERADMMDTQVGTSDKMEAGEVARIGFKAMMDGDGDVVAGMKNKLQSAVATVTPSAVLAEQHRKMAEPGSAKQ